MRMDPTSQQSSYASGGQRRGGLRWWVILLFGAYALYYYFSNQTIDPYTGNKAMIDTSIEEEAMLGLQAYNEVLSQEPVLDSSAEASRQIKAIAARLEARANDVENDLAKANGAEPQHIADSFQWDVSVIQSDQANAFCLPGGKMAVYTGLIPVAQNQDAMAVVMGHEIAHALLRHGSQRMAQQKLVQLGQMAAGVAVGDMDPQQQQMVMSALGAGTQYGVLLPFSRDHESQADEVGLMLAAAACFNPHEAIGLWERMSEQSGGQRPPEFASTHPDPANRIQHLQTLMPKAEQFYAKYCQGQPPAR
ncbi:M48 family metallopeptidase [Arenimonas oryziterrae]|nr:M48 family metallopeptidase [Arenimonas oryziterrae]